MHQFYLILPILYPILAGLILFLLPESVEQKKKNRYVAFSLILLKYFCYVTLGLAACSMDL